MSESDGDNNGGSYIDITSDLIPRLNWSQPTKIHICKCLHDIKATLLSSVSVSAFSPSKPQSNPIDICNSLTTVKFSALTKSSNILAIIQNCPNLLHLNFQDALLDDYSPFRFTSKLETEQLLTFTFEDRDQSGGPKFPISHQKILSLSIIASAALTKNEYWLIDFFTQVITLSKLQILRFYSILHGGQSDSSQRRWCYPEENWVMEKCGSNLLADPALVTTFIIKHRHTLKTINLGPCGLKPQSLVIDRSKQIIQNLENINNKVGNDTTGHIYSPLEDVSLSHIAFSLDGNFTEGIQYLLDCQSELKAIHHTALLHYDKNEFLNHESTTNNAENSHLPNFLATLYRCIKRNYQNLVELIITPILILDKNRSQLIKEDTIGTLFAFDATVLAKCSSLSILKLGLTAYRSEWDATIGANNGNGQQGNTNRARATLLGMRITHIDIFPQCLQNLTELNLRLEDYSKDELEVLGSQLWKFTKLKKLHLRASPLNSSSAFLIRLPWIKSLVQNCLDIEWVEFQNGILEDMDGTREFIFNQGQGQGQGQSNNNNNNNTDEGVDLNHDNFVDEFEEFDEEMGVIVGENVHVGGGGGRENHNNHYQRENEIQNFNEYNEDMDNNGPLIAMAYGDNVIIFIIVRN